MGNFYAIGQYMNDHVRQYRHLVDRGEYVNDVLHVPGGVPSISIYTITGLGEFDTPTVPCIVECVW